MAQTQTAPEVMTTADGIPLKVSLRRALRRQRVLSFLLVAPLLLFIIASFIIPIFEMTMRGVENPQVVNIMPRTVEALQSWDGKDLPDEKVFAALAADLKAGRESKQIGKVATRLNYEQRGMRSVIMGSARSVGRLKQGPYKEALIKIKKEWGQTRTWALIKRESAPYTLSYLLAAVDAGYDENGDIAKVPEKTADLCTAIRTYNSDVYHHHGNLCIAWLSSRLFIS